MWIQELGLILMALIKDLTMLILVNFFLGTGGSSPASSIGIYPLWKDSGFAADAFVAGLTADLYSLRVFLCSVVFLGFFSGWVVLFRMNESLEKIPKKGK